MKLTKKLHKKIKIYKIFILKKRLKKLKDEMNSKDKK